MRIFINLIPIILLSIIAYFFFYDLLPAYRETISLAKEINKLNNREKELNELQRIVEELNREPKISQLLNYKQTLEIWLPREPKTEEILAYLVNTYRLLNLGDFPGTSFNESQTEHYLISPYLLPVGKITFRLDFKNIELTKLQEVVSLLEKSGRFLKINKANLDLTDRGLINSSLEVEGYYLILNPRKEAQK